VGVFQVTTSQTTSFLTDIFEANQISVRTLAYFRARLRYRLHALVRAEFEHQAGAGKINRAALARRIGRKPEQVTRWLNTPGNWTLDTVSDLLIGMGAELDFQVSPIEGKLTAKRDDQFGSMSSGHRTKARSLKK
jgi:hypothetical protein